MKILFPDATFDDNAAIERDAFPADADLVLAGAKRADDIADAAWRSAEGLVVYIDIPIDAAVIGRLDSCKIITRAGVGFDHIDIEAAAKRGIPVCNVPDYGTTEVADHAIALMLGPARGLVSYHQRLIANPVAGWTWSGVPLVRRLRRTRFGSTPAPLGRWHRSGGISRAAWCGEERYAACRTFRNAVVWWRLWC